MLQISNADSNFVRLPLHRGPLHLQQRPQPRTMRGTAAQGTYKWRCMRCHDGGRREDLGGEGYGNGLGQAVVRTDRNTRRKPSPAPLRLRWQREPQLERRCAMSTAAPTPRIVILSARADVGVAQRLDGGGGK